MKRIGCLLAGLVLTSYAHAQGVTSGYYATSFGEYTSTCQGAHSPTKMACYQVKHTSDGGFNIRVKSATTGKWKSWLIGYYDWQEGGTASYTSLTIFTSLNISCTSVDIWDISATPTGKIRGDYNFSYKCSDNYYKCHTYMRGKFKKTTKAKCLNL